MYLHSIAFDELLFVSENCFLEGAAHGAGYLFYVAH